MPREPRITRRTLKRALAELTERDPDLAGIVRRHGPPPLWDREPGFPTLVCIILEQQVSIASARATFEKLRDAAEPLEPGSFLCLTPARLRKIGFSRQKAGYCRGLAGSIESGEVDLDAIGRLPGAAARGKLLAIKGVGPWTADIYLLMALGRPDVWPPGDLALVKAAQGVKRLRSLPDRARFEKLGEPWRPWRSVAARLLWHHYLQELPGSRSNG
ncbi:MAG: DNA-3-methyladenine glycosylase 2 family protein [Acidobacteriota bacterium]|nr:DNA-3-methyladenine glycosylase 2 family protein [Acidobacteriota bacterium]